MDNEKFIEEDWERAHLLDQIYLKEDEFIQEKPPAKIKFELIKKKEKI